MVLYDDLFFSRPYAEVHHSTMTMNIWAKNSASPPSICQYTPPPPPFTRSTAIHTTQIFPGNNYFHFSDRCHAKTLIIAACIWLHSHFCVHKIPNHPIFINLFEQCWWIECEMLKWLFAIHIDSINLFASSTWLNYSICVLILSIGPSSGSNFHRKLFLELENIRAPVCVCAL